MTPVAVVGLTKHLGETRAVDDVHLEVSAGELFFLLGPSGCGKTTLLNLIAGLLEPDSGRILFGDRDVTGLHTSRRNAVLCFQSYALWPHLSVADNVGFGLDVRRIDVAERRRRVREALELVQMADYGQRRPAELSGGQQQRVAIARAIVVRPACLLLDEPLSNLDTRLRQQMRGEIRRICRATGLTTLYVTHDQKEALSIADRIAIMSEGRVVQAGTPHRLYTEPETTFVAEFLGQANLLAGRVKGRRAPRAGAPAQVVVDTAVGPLLALSPPTLSSGAERVTLAIRPEQIRFCDEPRSSPDACGSEAGNRIAARLLSSSFLGDSSEHQLEVGGQVLRAVSVPARLDLPETVSVELPIESLAVLER
jgi:iron(III) transport system ATP-binding protein